MNAIRFLLAGTVLSAGLALRTPAWAADTVVDGTAVEQTVFLKPRDPQGEDRYARAVQSPGPLFHRFLSRDAFVQRFAPTDAQIAQVESALQQLGYTIRTVYPNHLAIAVSAPVSTTQRALGIAFARVRQGGRTGIVPVGEPVLPVSVRDLVRGMGGLDTLHVPVSQVESVPDAAPQLHTAGQALAGGKPGFLLPQDFAARYDVTPLYARGLDGRGATIGIVTLGGFDPAAARRFWQDAGIAVKPDRISLVRVGAGPGAPSNETFLDVEEAGGVAPQADLRIYEASSNGLLDGFEAAASENVADTVSASWGQAELDYFAHPGLHEGARTFLLDAFHDVFLEMGIQGQSVFLSGGDDGAFDTAKLDRVFGTPTVEDPVWNAPYAVGAPASDPAVTAAGGTTVPFSTTLADGVVLHVDQEQGWSTRYVFTQSAGQNAPIAFDTLYPKGGGGGVSSYFARPFYQAGTAGMTRTRPGQRFTRDTGSGPETLLTLPSGFDGRNMPDLSADADPRSGYQFIGIGGALLTHWGGTSFVAPQLNAVTALAVQRNGRVGALNPVLYGLGGAVSRDIAAGGNWGYAASPGYDNATGLGVLDGVRLVDALGVLSLAGN